MYTNNKLALRWPLIALSMGILMLMLACMGIAVRSTDAAPGTLLLGNGVVQVVDQSGNSVPVAGTSTFELVGALEGMDPWIVAGRTLETNESTQIEENLQVDDVVRVRGTILEDDTWLAYSIEHVEEETGPTITLIGKVTSIDPWVVNGITLNVTEETVINGEIAPGMIVRVEILLLPDGTWEVLSITPLGDSTEIPGCLTAMATVTSVNGNEIQLVGWPAITLSGDVKIENDDGSEATLSAGQDVLVVLCASEDGQIIIVQIIILVSDEDPSAGEGQEKVLICHKPDKKGGHTLSVAAPAVPAHLAHGDILGPCP